STPTPWPSSSLWPTIPTPGSGPPLSTLWPATGAKATPAHRAQARSSNPRCSMATDPDAHVRAMAAELVGKFVHTDGRAVTALETARAQDPSPTVRKKAG